MFGIRDLKELVADRGADRVSIFLPTHEMRPETKQDPIRLSNQLREVSDILGCHMRQPDVDAFLAPARELLENELFWLHQKRGLALFLSDQGMRTYRVAADLPEKIVVADRFHVKPLLPLLAGNERFYVLALSQNRVRLFEASRDGVGEMDLHDIPESLRDAVGYDWEQKSLQFHTGTPGGGGRRAAMFHGQGAGEDDSKDEIEKFFRRVDAGVSELLNGRRGPLVLAAVEYLMPIYRSVSRYPHVLDHGVAGNPDELRPEEIRDRAWKIVEPVFAATREKAESRYRERGGAQDVAAIVPAAFSGRVETLFVARDVECWGRFDSETHQVELHGSRQANDDDLFDVAAAEALMRDAEVYVVERQHVPGDNGIAACYRY